MNTRGSGYESGYGMLRASAKTTPCFYGPLAEFMGRGRMT
jgi:hypothetical protein